MEDDGCCCFHERGLSSSLSSFSSSSSSTSLLLKERRQPHHMHSLTHTHTNTHRSTRSSKQGTCQRIACSCRQPPLVLYRADRVCLCVSERVREREGLNERVWESRTGVRIQKRDDEGRRQQQQQLGCCGRMLDAWLFFPSSTLLSLHFFSLLIQRHAPCLSLVREKRQSKRLTGLRPAPFSSHNETGGDGALACLLP